MKTMYEIESTQNNIEAQISQLFKFVDDSVGKTEFHELEKSLFKHLQGLGLAFLKYFLAKSGTGYEPGNPPLASDGKPLEYKGTIQSPYFSIFGELTIEHARYRTEDGHYFYPFDAQVNLPEKKYSYLLQKWLQSGAVETNYRKAAERMNEIFDFCLFPSIPQRIGQEVCQHVDDFYQQSQPPTPENEGSHLGISADDKGIRILKSERASGQTEQTPKVRLGKGEKSGLKKQATVTVDFSFDPAERIPEEIVQALLKELKSREEDEPQKQDEQQQDQEQEKPRVAKNKHLRATLSGKEEAMNTLMQRVLKRDPEGQKPIIALLDGDPNLRKSLDKALQDHGLQNRVDAVILDIIHVSEYVWDVATALHGEKNNDVRIPWVREKLLDILQGKVGYVIGGFKQMITKETTTSSQQRVLKKAITYFENHRDMMDYKTYLEKGYHIATGLVEGTCNCLVKSRMELSGMRWTIVGATSILEQRAVKLNGDWNAFWNHYRQNQKAILYPDTYKIAA